MSSNLVWQVIRNNSSFLAKNSKHDGVVLTKEPNNLRQKNSFKYSGLASVQPVGLSKSGKGVALSTSVKGNHYKPAKQIKKLDLTHDVRTSARAITGVLATNKYRPDLKSDALARLSALNRKAAKPSSHKRAPRGNKK